MRAEGSRRGFSKLGGARYCTGTRYRYETTFLAISRTKIMRQVVCLSGRRPVPLCSGAEQKGLYKSGNAQIVPWSKVNKLRNKSGTG